MAFHVGMERVGTPTCAWVIMGFWWAIVDYYKELSEPLSCDFEVTSCLMDTYLTGLGEDARTEEEELKMQINTSSTPQEVPLLLFPMVGLQDN